MMGGRKEAPGHVQEGGEEEEEEAEGEWEEEGAR